MPQNKTFKIGKLELEYVNKPYNNTAVNERRVEVALGYEFHDKMLGWWPETFDETFVEVGAVMPYYDDPENYDDIRKHITLDLFDPHPWCTKQDARSFDYTGKNVLSISTIEHIGTSDYGAIPDDPHSAFALLDKIVKTANKYLITWPIGYNKVLDKDLYDSNIDYKMMARDCDNNWFDPSHGEYALMSILSRSDIFNFQYSKPFTCGNAIIIVSNLPKIMD